MPCPDRPPASAFLPVDFPALQGQSAAPMPIYEYKCETCGHDFEELVRGCESVSCPHCQVGDVRRKLSTFAKKSGGDSETFTSQPSASSSSGKCGGCSGGSCSSCH
ncbi:MAG: zinc ribbon domain-containing protein [Myxococcales bacterium]|nr:zinc ribbon domain-containing protein [Myxococcales bacterium]